MTLSGGHVGLGAVRVGGLVDSGGFVTLSDGWGKCGGFVALPNGLIGPGVVGGLVDSGGFVSLSAGLVGPSALGAGGLVDSGG